MPMQEIPGYYYDEEKSRYFKIMPTGPHSLAAIKAREAKKEEEQSDAMPLREIPGYYYDEEKNRYFKIMPTGPHSLAAIKARKAVKEEQQLQQRTKRRKLPIPPISTFCRWRETQSQSWTPTCLVSQGSRFLFKNLVCDTEIRLSTGTSAMTESHFTCMDFTSFPDTGEAIMSSTGGRLIRYGYQCDPFFHMWRTGFEWELRSDVTSLHFGKSDWKRRTVIGTTLGQGGSSPAQIWRYSYSSLPTITGDDAEGLCNEMPTLSQGKFKRGTVSSNVSRTSDLSVQRAHHYDRRKDTFWNSCSNDARDMVIVGSERGVTHLASNLKCISSVRTKSAVFSTKLLESRPHISLFGCRNGDIQLFDTRLRRTIPMFRQSSAVTHIMPFESLSSGNQLLAAGMDGSLCVWDIRSLNIGTQNSESRPLRKLSGHVNSHLRQIAFDAEPTMNLVVTAGSDNRLRIWSINELENSEPFWTSEKLGDGPIPAAKLMINPPVIQDAWNHWSSQPDGISCRRSPGLVVCAPSIEGFPAIRWFSISL
ncbi:hypothetical protein EC973_002466 [Apophysomyces ossiformis]|uniref:Uncharacterized protein n=1 Tax=Apophysomyces ossiformis TaxID=679940 RepID=A0A8H7BIA2_9FUNG|nr:hypothetical protein EC973_002466 [Apophysomyces ossiformis]